MITTVQIIDKSNHDARSQSAHKVVLPNEADIAALAQLYQKFKNNEQPKQHFEKITKTDIIPDKVSPEKLQDLYDSKLVESAPTQAPISRDSPLLFVLDNRIIPEQVGFRDIDNPNIWLHPRDIASPQRNKALHDKLLPLISIAYPSYQDDGERKIFTNAIRAILPKDPNLSDAPPKNPFPPAIKTSAFNAPLSHIVNGEPFPQLLTQAEIGVYRDANAIYMMLDYKLSHQNQQDENVGGYPKLLRNTVEKLARRGDSEATIDQLMHGLEDALGITTEQFVRTAANQGVQGVAQLLNIEPQLTKDIINLMDSIKERSFPLNDVLNWEYGRQLSAPNASIAQIVENGKEERITQMTSNYRKMIDEMAAVPNQINNEMLLASSLNLVPPVVREAFFEMGGQFIITKDPDLYNVINQAATGFNISYQSNNDINQSLNQIFVSGDPGLLTRTAKTVVHELHHMLFPQYISPEQAIYGDNLLNRDEVRLNIFKKLADQYLYAGVKGDVAKQNQILEAFDSPEYAVDGKRFSEMLDRVSMPIFLSGIYDAFENLQLQSPFFNRIEAYQKPEQRWREIIPRFAELKFVQHEDRQNLIDFLVPNINKIYEELYLPNLQQQIDLIRQQNGSKYDKLMSSFDSTMLNNMNTNIDGWTEQLNNGKISIEHPVGDINAVSYNRLDTKHPTIAQNYNSWLNNTMPTASINAKTIEVQPMIEKQISAINR